MKEKEFTDFLIYFCGKYLKENAVNELTRSDAEYVADICSKTMGYKGTLDGPINTLLSRFDQKMELGALISGKESEHNPDWVYSNNDITWAYSTAYEDFLRKKGKSPTIVNSLDVVGKKILSQLQDPKTDGDYWKRRGLVIGDVQSGKTANYIDLIAKAADAGYKFFVVIAGIHNILRKQTQVRIDEGFVGKSSDPNDNKKNVGVGEVDGYLNPITLTTTDKDFDKRIAGGMIDPADLTNSKPLILVIKKNARTLNSLSRWLKDFSSKEEGSISKMPILVIDDEADFASINTNKDGLNPTTINKRIREILSIFDKSCFIGYTATPYANIFIDPSAYEKDVREDLFPKDFIYSLDAPSNYFGSEKVFLNDDSSEKILHPIYDAEKYLPAKHKKDSEVHELPPSLYMAISQFIIIKAIRILRGDKDEHCTMMIHISRFVNIQQQVRSWLVYYLDKLKSAVKANYKMLGIISSRNEYMGNLENIFHANFSDKGFEWKEVKGELLSAAESIRCYVINSKSDESLDYKKHEDDGTGLTAIAVGGLSLSRGLTLEGLCVSYMYRNTKMYDSLMQMGRWFGYRNNYEDLCKVHLTQDSIDWYAHIARATYDLKNLTKQMSRDNRTPKEFGLYIETHPGLLEVTAANKSRNAGKILMKINCGGTLFETHILPTDEKINSNNLRLIDEYWRIGFGTKGGETKKGWIFRDVETQVVYNFIQRFEINKDLLNRNFNGVSEYLNHISDKYQWSDVLLISPKDNNSDIKNFKLGFQSRKSAVKTKGDLWRLSKGRVASRGDERLGLSEADKAKAEQEVKGGKAVSDIHYRKVRNKPLLMIHLLELGNNEDKQTDIPAYGISFPPSEPTDFIQKEVLGNIVYLDESKEDEEDYDD